MSESPFSKVIGSVYDCIADDSLWPSSLKSVCGFSEGCLATLGVVDTVNKDARFLASWGDAGILNSLMGEFSDDVPFYNAVPHMQLDTPYTVDAIYELQGSGAREKWLNSRIVQEWVIPNQLDDFFWVPLIKQPSRTGTLVVVTDRNRRNIDSNDIQKMSELAPHVRRAVTIGDLFAAGQRRAELFETVLDALQTPVFIVGADLDIVFANQAAEHILREATLFAANSFRMQCTYPPAHRSLAHAVSLGTKDEGSLAGFGINVPLGRGDRPAVAHVLPLARRDRSVRVAANAAAAVFVGMSGQTFLPAIEAIAALFGLTSAETRVANLVAAGQNRQQIAENCGTSTTTVQSQLSAIFDKTNSHDQRSLELLIHDLSPPVRANQKPTFAHSPKSR